LEGPEDLSARGTMQNLCRLNQLQGPLKPLFAWLLIVLGLAIPYSASAKDLPVIDGHNHLMGRFRTPRGLVLDYEGAAKVALATMQRLGISKMVIMPPPFPPHHPNRYDIEDLMGVIKRYPRRFALLGGGGSLNPMIQRALQRGEVSPRLRKEFERRALEILKKGALGFGEMAVEHLSFNPRHPYEWAPPDHPLLLLLVDIAARFCVPIDLHMEAVPRRMPLPTRFSSPPNPRTLRPNIEAFERLLAHNRRAKIIWAHAGWDNTGYRTAHLCGELLKRHPNLYMSLKVGPDSRPDNSPLDPRGRIKPEWLELIGAFPDRFFIGSDRFFVTPEVPRRIGPPSPEALKILPQLPRSLARKVSYENARAIFNLD